MSQLYCPKCGNPVAPGSSFCAACGTPFAQPQQPVYAAPPVQPAYAPMKPKVPGKGIGVAALVVGLIGIITSVIMFFSAVEMVDLNSYYSYSYYFDAGPVIAGWFFLAIPNFLGIIFGACSLGKGCKSGVSKTGLILSSIGAGLFLIAAIMVGSI